MKRISGLVMMFTILFCVAACGSEKDKVKTVELHTEGENASVQMADGASSDDSDGNKPSEETETAENGASKPQNGSETVMDENSKSVKECASSFLNCLLKLDGSAAEYVVADSVQKSSVGNYTVENFKAEVLAVGEKNGVSRSLTEDCVGTFCGRIGEVYGNSEFEVQSVANSGNTAVAKVRVNMVDFENIGVGIDDLLSAPEKYFTAEEITTVSKMLQKSASKREIAVYVLDILTRTAPVIINDLVVNGDKIEENVDLKLEKNNGEWYVAEVPSLLMPDLMVLEI